MAGKFALIIGNSHYDDPNLGRLRAPDLDVQALEEVLKAPHIGQFDEVTTLLNEGCASVRKAVARFYDRRQRDDLLLLYFSGHGVKDEQGHLYLALRDTESTLLAGSAIETAFITARMDRSYSKRQVLVLDCCHSGAFANGAKAAQGVSVGTAEAFEGTGLGRVVLTATDSTQYAWEGDRIIGDADTSLFTHYLIDGLKTGAADRDDDGVVTVDELYDYVREHVVDASPRQTPRKWSYRQEGDIVVAQNPFSHRSTLPPEIEEAKSSKLSSLRLEAVRDLAKLLRGHHRARARAALAALKKLSHDDSRKVANAALQALKGYEEERQGGVQRPLAEPASAPQNVPDVVAPAPAVPPTDHDRDLTPRVERRHSGAHVNGLPSDIFISYEHQDRQRARALANALIAQGWTVWWDRRIAPGEAFDVVIERELGVSKCVIVLWSSRSVGATWVRNEARRAAKRKVLVPILIEPVEPPLEFENLQAADLTTWEVSAEHPEFDAVLDRIQALAPTPYRLARVAVENARREFSAGRVQAALASLEQFRPENALVSQALTELRAEAERLEGVRAEAVRREAEAAQRQQRLAVAVAEIEALLGRSDFDAADRALTVVEKEFDRPAECGPLRERSSALRDQARRDELARTAERLERERAETARLEAEAARQVESVVEPPVSEHLPVSHELATQPEPVPTGAMFRARALVESRAVRIMMAGALVVVIVGTVIVGVRRWQAPRDTGEAKPPQDSPSAPSGSGLPTDPPTSPDNGRAATRTESLLPSRPLGGLRPSPGAVLEDRPLVSESIARGAVKPPPSSNVEAVRTRARSQEQSGQHAQALTTVIDGLRLYPKDPGLTSILNSLLSDAMAAATRAKQDALDVAADARAEDLFGQGLQKERQALGLRRSGRIDGATRAYWEAADQFTEAAATARRLAEDEKAAKPETTPSAKPQEERPPLDTAFEQTLVEKVLRQYEAAYARRDVEAVRRVYPGAPIAQLTQEFARSRRYTLTIKVEKFDFGSDPTQIWFTVPAQFVHEVVPQSGPPNRVVLSQTIRLVKQDNVWTILSIR